MFHYGCDQDDESVLHTLIRNGIQHQLVSILPVIYERGSMRILYTLIIHFAVEKVLSLSQIVSIAIYCKALWM